jgi:hypothetical protein
VAYVIRILGCVENGRFQRKEMRVVIPFSATN